MKETNKKTRKNIKESLKLTTLGFTLVELLAVIVILAIILVIAVPKVMNVIEDAKKATLESTAKMIASAAEKSKVQNQVLGNDKAITCEGITNINDVDYASCDITFDENTAKVTIEGSGKFEGLYVCNGTKTSATATEEECSGTGGTGALPGGNGGESHNGTIPAGAYYGNTITGTFYDEMPATVSEGDIYLYGDYYYMYTPSLNGWSVKLATAEDGISYILPDYPVTDRNQGKYDDILLSINNKSIVDMNDTFENCVNMTESPVIPNHVTQMDRTFWNCTSLSESPVIPVGVTTMHYTFRGCTNLTKAPVIPNRVSILSGTFSFTNLAEAPVIPESVTTMSQTFEGCTNLTKAPVIPANVTNVNSTFQECTNLTGEVVINANLVGGGDNSNYYNCFYLVDMSKITLTGSSSMLNEIGATGLNYTPQ